MEVNYSRVARPTDSARQRGLILLPLDFFSLMLHRSTRYRKLFVVGVVPSGVLALLSPAFIGVFNWHSEILVAQSFLLV